MQSGLIITDAICASSCELCPTNFITAGLRSDPVNKKKVDVLCRFLDVCVCGGGGAVLWGPLQGETL